MVKFLDSDGIKSEISTVLKKSDEFIYIVSPFLKIGDRYRGILKDIADQGKEIRIVYGKEPLKDSEMEWFRSVDAIGLHYYKELHAKCYMNEKAAIITSLNLYEYSLINNYEMGIMISREQDPETYNEILEDVRRLMRISEEVKAPTKTILGKIINMIISAGAEHTEYGFCIRCGERIPFDAKHPYCSKDFESWNKYRNRNYIEKSGFCHCCGRKNQSSMIKPVCMDCYRRLTNDN